jgi:hypothetical protein
MTLVALLFELVIGGAMGHAPLGELPAWARPDLLPSSVMELRSETGATGSSPACIAEFCQPRIAIPGREPEFDTAGKRTELALAVIDGMKIGVISTIARAVQTSGLQIDYRPAQLESDSNARHGFGKLNVGVRWRLDAWHGPTWLGPAR